ncbi:MAG: Tab2/Atab2 family RNA-binding protein [Xenococcaceae cyanobacterium MO_167.B27]|nr:Tab2/Atab2 family RNA-binding protein [Xenococcaceae cyanobacterium MO_167.B27]
MVIWQCDFYHIPVSQAKEKPSWLLFISDPDGNQIHTGKCLQAEANSSWLIEQLRQAGKGNLPEKIQIFRPQIVGLFKTATEALSIELESTRRTRTLKQKIRQYMDDNFSTLSGNKYFALDKPPPQPLPESLWGENWSFVSIAAGEITNFIEDRPIPFKEIPESLLPMNLGIASNVVVPGIVVYGGRNSFSLCRWLQEQKPVALNYIPTEIGQSGGLVLESGLVDRWIFNTFEDESVAQAAKSYEDNKQISDGLHFLLIQPDDSGMTYTGFWLLKDE